jgi:uncharacterized protein with FMN-binding domain
MPRPTERFARPVGPCRSRLHLPAAALFVLVAVALVAPVARAEPSNRSNETYVANGPVVAIAPAKDTTYIGGASSEVGSRDRAWGGH